MQVMTLLLQHGADPNGVDERGNSKLYYVCGYITDPTKIQVLLNHGANPNFKCQNGRTPFHEFLDKGIKQNEMRGREYEITKLFLEKGAVIDMLASTLIDLNCSYLMGNNAEFRKLIKAHDHTCTLL